MRALMVVTLCVAGCGYRFTAGGGRLPEGTREVWAPVFANRTAEPGLEATFTQAFREQLIRAGVDGEPRSEARAEGEILSVTGVPTLASGASGPASYRLTATAIVRLKKGERVLAEARVTASEDYLAGADPLQSEAGRAAALHRLATAMMREAYGRLTTSW